MNRFVFFTLLILTLYSCKNSKLFPLPTGETVVKMDMEEGSQRKQKEEWFTMIHGGPNSNWQNQEYENMLSMLSYKQRLNKTLRDGEETYADGQVYGKWIERGSANQAGSVMNVFYDKEDDYLYAIGAGGPMFRSGIEGFNWELVNDDIRFDAALLEVIKNGSEKRLIAGINGIPHYSDDGGQTWNKSEGISATSDGRDIQTSFTARNNIFVLLRRGYDHNYTLYKSIDGKKYDVVKIFPTSNDKNVKMCRSTDEKDVYVIEKKSNVKSSISKINFASGGSLVSYNLNANIGFGSNGNANIQCVQNNTDTVFYVYSGDLKLQSSSDKGSTWKQLSTLPTSPWNVGLLVVPSNPEVMIYGEVNAVRSKSGGLFWNNINEWWEYYGNVKKKLHADIMVMREFDTKSGKKVLIIGHHGGISISYNAGENTENISLFGLHVSQYYDVKTYPADITRLFAGAQDQGLQRGGTNDDFVADFQQMISGDYGHIQFTNHGKSMWTMYPGGSISFYENPLSQDNPSAGYEINSQNETVWIPPIAIDPNSNKNEVYVAGGSIDASSTATRILKISFDGFGLVADELPFDFSVSGGQISAITISKINSLHWYVATTNGFVYKSIDGGNDFELIHQMTSGAHYLYGSCVLLSDKDINTVYVSGSGYGSIAPVYVSTDGGEHFLPMSDGMPSTVAFKLAQNTLEDRLFAATEAGPYVYVKQTNKWYPLVGKDTPNQTYWSVEYVSELKTARFATYGRGVWDFLDKSDAILASKESGNQRIAMGPNPCSDHFEVFTDDKIKNITIFDLGGKEVVRHKSTEKVVNTSALLPATYLLKITTDKSTYTQKMVKI